MIIKVVFLIFTAVAAYLSSIWAFDSTQKRIEQTGDANETDILPYKSWTKYVSGILIAAVWAGIAFFIYDICFTKVGFLQISTIVCATIAAAIVDFKLKIIPNIISLLIMSTGTILHICSFVFYGANTGFLIMAKQILIYNVIAMIALAIILLLLSRIVGGMGVGDIKLLSSMCYCGGISLVLGALSNALLIAAGCGVFFVLSKVKKFKDDVPFAPFIALGSIITVCLGLA